MVSPLRLEDLEPPAPKAGDIKTMFPEETIKWKQDSSLIIKKGICVDNMETYTCLRCLSRAVKYRSSAWPVTTANSASCLSTLIAPSCADSPPRALRSAL